MIAKMAHTMIRVLDDQRSIKFYEDVLGFSVIKRADLSDFSLIFMGNELSDFELELTYNHGREEAYELGNGYGHLAVSVPDIRKKRQNLIDKGYSPLEIKSLSAESTGFFFITDPDGYKIEFIQRER